jgi:hypothetical protein
LLENQEGSRLRQIASGKLQKNVVSGRKGVLDIL